MIRTRRAVMLAVALSLSASSCSSSGSSSTTPTSSQPPSTSLSPTPSDSATTGTSSTPGGTTAAGGAVKVGFVTKFPVDFYDTMVDAVKTWNKAHADVHVIFAQGKSGTDDEGEISAIESMVTQGVAAIAITPTSPNVKDALQKAVDKGIKVVLIDNDIPGWDAKTSVVATDNKAGGVLAGKWLKDHLKAGAKIAVLQGVLGAPSLDARVTGMLEGLGGAAKIVAKSATDCDQTKGLNATQDILTAHPDIVGIYGACGPPILGAIEAVKGAGKKPSSLTIVGFDAGGDEIKAIKAGDEAGSVAQFPAKMGSLGIQTAVDAASGKPVQKAVDTGTAMVTKANAASFG